MLPIIEAPSYEITLPVSKKTLKFRPFLVKEQKILLMAMESKEDDVTENNVKQVLQNCTLSDIDVNSLPLVDIEYYFLNLRARSVGEVVETRYKCENDVGGKPCGNVMETSFNVLDVEVELPENTEETIEITPDVGVKMKYPSFSVVDKLKGLDAATDMAFELILECVDYVYDKDNFYYAHETPKEELMAFIESLTNEQFLKLEKFVENLPKIHKNIEIVCSKCGFVHNIEVQGLNNFFS